MFLQRIDYIKSLQYKSYACKRSLEIFPENMIGKNYDLAVNRYGDFLKEKLKNPITADLAMKKVLEEHPVQNKKDYNENLKLVKENSMIKDLLAKLEQKKASQPYSSKLREKLIAENRLDLLYVTPKLTGFEKFLLRLKLIFNF